MRAAQLTPLGAPTFDFGDVLFAPLPCIASGQVVDEDGDPVAGARFEVQSPERTEDGTWCQLAEESDPQGRFVLASPWSPQAFELRARASSSSVGAAVHVERGAQDVRLVVDQTGTVHGRLLLPEGITITDFSLSLVRVDGDSEAVVWASGLSYNDKNEFEYGSLAPGRWKLRFSMGMQTTFDSEAFEAWGGEHVRLADLDLRDQLELVTLQLVDERGGPLADGTVEILDPTRFETTYWGDADGLVRIPIAAADQPGMDVIAKAPSRRASRVSGVHSKDVLTLGPGIPCRLRWPTGLPSVDPAWSVSACLRCTSDSELARIGGALCEVLDTAGATPVALPMAGEFEVEIRLFREVTLSRIFLQQPSQVFAVTEGQAGLEVELVVDPFAWLRVLEQSR